MRILYLDCFSGISGDMTVGALLDAGVDQDTLFNGIASLPISGYRLSAEKVTKAGITATQFRVDCNPEAEQPHRHLRHVVEIIESGKLPGEVKQAAIETFELLADAEGAVHGVSREKVHFHEVGAIDAIVDITAAQYGFYLLGAEAVYASAVHVGSGTVKCDHGIMPVPAPATAKLLEGKPVRIGTAIGELVTPTGAALLKHRVTAFGAMPEMTVSSIGYGSGTRDLPDRANVLRVLTGESVETGSSRDAVMVIETLVDDMNPELYPVLTERLLALGARDTFITPVTGKKGRPAHLLTVLCDEKDLDAVTDRIFRESTTFGLRYRREERRILDRAWQEVSTPWGVVRVKTGSWQGETVTWSPEFEDCRAYAEKADVSPRQVYDAAIAAMKKKGE